MVKKQNILSRHSSAGNRPGQLNEVQNSFTQVMVELLLAFSIYNFSSRSSILTLSQLWMARTELSSGKAYTVDCQSRTS